MEDWIVYSVKTENKLIYELISKIKESINNEVPHIEFHLKYFDPLLEYKIIDYTIAPKIVLPSACAPNRGPMPTNEVRQRGKTLASDGFFLGP